MPTRPERFGLAMSPWLKTGKLKLRRGVLKDSFTPYSARIYIRR